MYIYIYIHISAVELLSGPSLAFLIVTNWAKFVCFSTLFVKQHYKNKGFSRSFFKKKVRAQFLIGTNWAKLVFFGHQLGPSNSLTWPS